MCLANLSLSDALGIKLGHRRLLQREIALTKGTSMGQRITSGQQNAAKLTRSTEDDKADENAPERPPSAYVIFSNKVREELKPQHLSFTAIAKKVGEMWQDLSAEAKEPYESAASSAKEKYHSEMSEYKTTKSHREYQQYLADFRAKNSSTSNDKRPKLSQDETAMSSGSIGSISTESFDYLAGNSDSRAPRLGSHSSTGPYSGASAISSPASAVSASPAFRPGVTSTIAPRKTSPVTISPSTNSTFRPPLSSSQTPVASYTRRPTQAHLESTSPDPGQFPPSSVGDNPHSSEITAASTSLDPNFPRNRTASFDILQKSRGVLPSLPYNTSNASSRSSVTSSWSTASTADSSVLSIAPLDKPKNTGLSLPTLGTLTGTLHGGSLNYTDPVVTRQNLEPLASRSTTSELAQDPSQSSSSLSSKGMKFESLQLPLPHNISFGQRPMPQSEHEGKLANIFDLQDIPGERRSFKDLTLQQDEIDLSASAIPQGPPEPRHPPYVPKLPGLDPRSRDESRDHGLEPDADPLSVLAYAGRLVGQEGRHRQ
ncbi:hypothetical protein ACLMJK_005895 [Lecanora helva]